jgi:hypothetical protein
MHYAAPRECGLVDECEWQLSGSEAEIAKFELPLWITLTAVIEPTDARRKWKNSLQLQFA